jgi:hypothetical protein
VSDSISVGPAKEPDEDEEKPESVQEFSDFDSF